MFTSKETEHFLVTPEFLNEQFKKVIVPPSTVDINRLALLYKFKYIQTTEKTNTAKKPLEYYHSLTAKRKNPLIKGPEETPGTWRYEMNQWLSNKKNQLDLKPCRHEPYITRY